jgi:hypothetical protein
VKGNGYRGSQYLVRPRPTKGRSLLGVKARNQEIA